MSSTMSADLSALCSNLGHSDGVRYYPDKDCYESAKDLMRYLRRDDASFEVRRMLGSSQILATDLLPLMDVCHEVHDHFSIVLRLIVNLTNPPLLLYKEQIPTEKTARNHYLQLVAHLGEYKKAFTNENLKVWEIIRAKMSTVLEIECSEREEEQGTMLEHCLILLRNVLHVPPDADADKRPENDASVHDELLWRLHTCGVKDLVLFIASTKSEQQYYVYVLEIVSLMFREQSPKLLASAAAQRSAEERQRDERQLLATRTAESVEKMLKVQRAAGARHSRFGGTFVVKNVKSISEQDQIVHKPLAKMEDALKFDSEKKKRKTPKNRLPLKDADGERRSAFSIRLMLKEFCVEFLNGAYNHLMSYVKSMIDHQSAQDNDESFYLWAMRFLMEFNRRYDFKVELVSETMNVATFHFVTMQMEKYQEMMKTDKPMIPLWAKRLHLAIQAYNELLQTLHRMDADVKEEVRKSSSVIKSNVFYLAEYREVILSILLNYDEKKFSKVCLVHLIQAVHIFLKLLKQFSTQRSNLVVQTAQKKKRATKKKKPKKSAPAAGKSLEELWFDIGPELSAILQQSIQPTGDYVPFDATLDKPIDDQKGDAMRKIQAHLRTNRLEDALGLLRASREVWPENDSFGNAHMAPEQELMAMQEIFMADIGAGLQAPPADEPEASSEDEEEGEGGSDDDAQQANVNEASFEYKEFVFRFAHETVIRAYGHALRLYATNSDTTNYCINKMFNTIACVLHLPSLLFQTSLLITFEKICESKDERYKGLVFLAHYVVHNLRKVASKNSKVWAELFFFKSRKDVDAIEEGDYTVRSKPSASLKKIWSEQEEFELRRLCEEFQSDEDVRRLGSLIDFVMENIINKERSQASVVKKLKELGFLETRARKTARGDGATKKKRGVAAEENITYTSKDIIDTDDISSDDSGEESSNAAPLALSEQTKLIRQLVRECKDVSGGSEVLEWVIKEMKDLSVERRNNDIDDDVPDSPIFSDSELVTAGADLSVFQKLFKTLGFEQGTFLTIPGKIVWTQLDTLVNLLEQGDVEEPPIESEVLDSDSEIGDRQVSGNETRSNAAVGSDTKHYNETGASSGFNGNQSEVADVDSGESDMEGSDNDDETETKHFREQLIPGRKRRRVLSSGSDASDNDILPKFQSAAPIESEVLDSDSEIGDQQVSGNETRSSAAVGSYTKQYNETGASSGFSGNQCEVAGVDSGESDMEGSDNDDKTETKHFREQLIPGRKRRRVLSSGSDASDNVVLPKFQSAGSPKAVLNALPPG